MAALELLKTAKNDDGKIVSRMFMDPGTKTKVILVDNVRASFPFVGRPGKDAGDDDSADEKTSYRIIGMLPKSTHEAAYNMIRDLIKELQKNNDVTVPSTEWFLQDGDGEKYQEEKYKVMNGHWLITCKDAKVHPRVYNERGQPMDLDEKGLDVIENKFYGGCGVNILLRPWYFNGIAKGKSKKYPKRILAGLSSVQFHHDDKPFGQGKIDDTGLFGAVEGAGNGMDDDGDDL